jgi:hypothetical protein
VALISDIYYISWIKAAFVVSLRTVFGSAGTALINMIGGLSSSGTSLVYDTDSPTDPFLKGDYIIVDDEILKITNVVTGTNTLTVTRGAQRTIAVAHPDNTSITKSYVAPQYLYDDDEEKTKIQIYTAFPIRNFKAPTIVVNATTGGAQVSFIGPQEEIREQQVDGDDHLYFSGILRVGLEIKVYAGTMTDAEKLSDFVIVFLRFLLRDKLAELRLSYTDISFGGISTEPWNDELLYVATINISNVHSEYELVFPKSLLTFVEQINIEEKVKLMLDEEIVNTKVP